jgi:hypothetical protein
MTAPQPSLFADPEHEHRQAERMRGQKAVIKVAVSNPDGGPPTFRERDAVVYGPLALMPVVVFDRYEGRSRNDGWNITHVETGFAVAPSIPLKADALRIIYLLKDEDWYFRRPADIPEDLQPKVRHLVEEAAKQ